MINAQGGFEMMASVEQSELQTFLQQSYACYPALAGVFQSDIDVIESVLRGNIGDVSVWWLALVAVGRMQGIASAMQQPRMVMYFSEIATMLVQKLYTLDRYLRTV